MYVPKKILMVCLGNICRSPLAHGILEAKIIKYKLDWIVDSAGTSGWHDGEPPDLRACRVAKNFGISIDHQISRKITLKDLETYYLILAMDAQNYQDILKLAQQYDLSPRIEMLMNLAYPGKNQQVPDPYYDGRFEEVYQLLDVALEKYIQGIVKNVETI